MQEKEAKTWNDGTMEKGRRILDSGYRLLVECEERSKERKIRQLHITKTRKGENTKEEGVI
jgi:hypothetical protein